MNSICNEDCFHCPYPDCVRDDLTADTYAELALLEKTIINPPTAKQRKLAAQQRAYYEANKEKVAARQRAYREANKEKVSAYNRAYREANKEKLAAYNRAYREAHKDKWREYNRRSRAKKKALAAAATTDKGRDE